MPLGEDSLLLAKGSKGERIVIDDEHFGWRFDGEYWKDELGFYRYRITSKCNVAGPVNKPGPANESGPEPVVDTGDALP